MEERFEIKESERQSWLSLAFVWTGSMICIPCLMIGGIVGTGLSLWQVVLAVLVGYGIVCTYMCLVGMESCDTGLPTVSMAASVLGRRGAQFIISLMLAIACIGWFGIQSAVCGESFSAMVADFTGFEIPVWLSSVFWGIIMLLTAVYGYNGLKILNYIAVPALVIVLVYSMVLAFSGGGFATVASYVPASRMSFISAVSMVVASFALGGVISGDYSRYARSRKDVVKSTLLGVFPSGLVMMLVGSILSIVTGQYDISLVLAAVGVPALGLVALVLATWTTNVTNAYSGGLAVSNLLGLGEDKFKISCSVAGLVGTVLAAVGLLLDCRKRTEGESRREGRLVPAWHPGLRHRCACRLHHWKHRGPLHRTRQWNSHCHARLHHPGARHGERRKSMRKISKAEINDIALGASLLGAGGGGDPYIGRLIALDAIEECGPVTLLSPDEVPDDAFIVPIAMMGAPTVLCEKAINGGEYKALAEMVESYFKKKIFAFMPIEAGGVNSMLPFAAAARLGLPLVDCDGMGRAFPELQMVTFTIGGMSATPMALTDEKGNSCIFNTITNKWTEELARAVTMACGGSVSVSLYTMTGAQMKKYAVRDIVTRSERLGKALRLIKEALQGQDRGRQA